MKTFFITGHDTGIGKTFVTGLLAQGFAEKGLKVQVIKPVETGIAFPRTEGDIHTLLKRTKYHPNIDGHTFFTYPAPLAPFPAAELVGDVLTFEKVVEAFQRLSATTSPNVRLIDGCGGIAVPFDADGRDQRDLALHLKVDCLVLVIENRLGAMNRSRLLHAYAHTNRIDTCFFLNTRKPQPTAITQSNLKVLNSMGLPVFDKHNITTLLSQYEHVLRTN